MILLCFIPFGAQNNNRILSSPEIPNNKLYVNNNRHFIVCLIIRTRQLFASKYLIVLTDVYWPPHETHNLYIKALLKRFLSVSRMRRCLAKTAERFIFKLSVIDVKRNVYQVQTVEDVPILCTLIFLAKLFVHTLVDEYSSIHFHLLTIDWHYLIDFTTLIEC